MFKTKNIASAMIVAVASGFWAQAAAADAAGPAGYLGADLGHAEMKPGNRSFIHSTDFSDAVWAVHGGYRLSPYFAVEATYADLGDYRYQEECPAICIPEEFPRNVRVSGARSDLALVGSVPLGKRFEAYAKAGIAHTEVETEARSLNADSRTTDSSSGEIYGLGLRLRFRAPWSLRLQWDRIPNLGESESDVDTWWLGAEYRFVRGQR